MFMALIDASEVPRFECLLTHKSIVLSHDAVQQKAFGRAPFAEKGLWRRSSSILATIVTPHIRNTPNFVSGIGALSAAETTAPARGASRTAR